MIYCLLVVVLGIAGLGESRSLSLLPGIFLVSWISCMFYALLVVVRSLARASGGERATTFAASKSRQLRLAFAYRLPPQGGLESAGKLRRHVTCTIDQNSLQ
jgi:hypothetical protein